MPDVLLVAAGAALGAPARWWTDRALTAGVGARFPWGTFTVNVVGSFLMGVLIGADLAADRLGLLVGVGFLGAFTTYSSSAWESHRLAEDGARLLASANVVGTLLACLTAAATGWWLGARLPL